MKEISRAKKKTKLESYGCNLKPRDIKSFTAVKLEIYFFWLMSLKIEEEEEGEEEERRSDNNNNNNNLAIILIIWHQETIKACHTVE